MWIGLVSLFGITLLSGPARACNPYGQILAPGALELYGTRIEGDGETVGPALKVKLSEVKGLVSHGDRAEVELADGSRVMLKGAQVVNSKLGGRPVVDVSKVGHLEDVAIALRRQGFKAEFRARPGSIRLPSRTAIPIVAQVREPIPELRARPRAISVRAMGSRRR
jgi:hypothetical protein